MYRNDKSTKLESTDRMTAALLRWSPWLIFLLLAFPAPFYFLWRYFTASEDVAVYMLLALSSLAIGSMLGLFVVALFFLYRKYWERKLRDRLASDGITTDELVWFRSELTSTERRALKQLDEQNLLLADAYRETLAARLTASRMIAKSGREIGLVDRRLREAVRLQGTDSKVLREELQSDRERLQRISQEAKTHLVDAETRLRMIEATASRGANEAETRIALERLGLTRGQTPYALEAARLELEAREQANEIFVKEHRALESKKESTNPDSGGLDKVNERPLP